MRIDERIEESVRKAFSAVVAKDGDTMVKTILALGEKDAETAVRYALYVVGYVVNNAHPHGATNADLRAMASDLADGVADWVNVGDTDTVASFLRSAASGDTTFEGIPAEDVPGTAFVCGGYLLARYRLEDQRWWEYLNEVWEAAEAAPDLS